LRRSRFSVAIVANGTVKRSATKTTGGPLGSRPATTGPSGASVVCVRVALLPPVGRVCTAASSRIVTPETSVVVGCWACAAEWCPKIWSREMTTRAVRHRRIFRRVEATGRHRLSHCETEDYCSGARPGLGPTAGMIVA
jgi:hypothetical protein